MNGFSQARASMVDSQVHSNDVTDRRLLAAMREIPRELFVAERFRDMAYIDDHVPFDVQDGDDERFLMAPMPFARLVQLAGIKDDDLILDVGCATGYSSAILARLGGWVVALESDPHLAALASSNLSAVKADNLTVTVGPLTSGHPNERPYDVIFFNGAVEEIPQVFFDQCGDGGRLVAVVLRDTVGEATLFQRNGATVSRRCAFDANVRPLPCFSKSRGFVF